MTAPAAGRVPDGRVLRAAALVACLCTLSVLLFGAGTATAEPQSLLAGAGACAGADSPTASAVEQRKAIVCLVNLARRHAGKPALATPLKLRRAAAIKGHDVASCGQLSHTPCGDEPTAALRSAGYRYSWFGENLWVGTWGAFTPRHVVESWLGSPGHRENILRSGFRHFGTARVRATGVFGEPTSAVWVATFASPLET